MRRCSLCKTEKSEDQFSSNDYRCRECNRERARKYREKYPNRVKQSQVKYSKTDKAKERSKRWRANGGSEYQAAWAANNPDKRKATRDKYYLNHVEAERQRNAAYRAANPEKIKAASRASYYKNRERELLRAHLRRHEKFDFVVSEKELRKLYSDPCVACGSMENQTVDHIVPFSRGGRYSIGNLQTLCLSCNVRKANRTIMEWRLGRIARRNRKQQA